MVTRRTKVCQPSSNILNTLIEVKGEFCLTQHVLLLVKCFLKTFEYLLLRLDFFDSVCFLLLLELAGTLKVFLYFLLLCSDILDGFVLLRDLVLPVLLLEHRLFKVKLFHQCLANDLLFFASLLSFTLLLALLHFDSANISDEVFCEPLDLPIEVYVCLGVLGLRLSIAQVLRRPRQQTH